MPSQTNAQELSNRPSTRSFKRSLCSVLAVSLTLISGCDPTGDGELQAAQSESEAAQASDMSEASQDAEPFISEPSIIYQREDLVAYAPSDIPNRLPLASIVLENHREVDPRYIGRPKIVAYVGPIVPRRDCDGNPDYENTKFDVGNFDKQYPNLAYTEGTRVYWANLRRNQAFLIIYPDLPGQSQGPNGFELETEDYDPPKGAREHIQVIDPDTELPDPSSTLKRREMRGALVGSDTRFAVYDDNEPVSGRRNSRMISMGGGTGSLIGRQHFVTAAHVVVDQNDARDEHNEDMLDANEIGIPNLNLRVARNGNKQIGDTAKPLQLFWLADYMTAPLGPARRSLDIAWGVMDKPHGDIVGYFGYNTEDQSPFDDFNPPLRNVGYPLCSEDSEPVPPTCTRRHLFADSAVCDVLNNVYPGPDRQTQGVQHGCDTNAGYGGSPLVMSKAGNQTVWAVHSGESYGDNYAARITRHRAFELFPDMYNKYPRSAGE